MEGAGSANVMNRNRQTRRRVKPGSENDGARLRYMMIRICQFVSPVQIAECGNGFSKTGIA